MGIEVRSVVAWVVGQGGTVEWPARDMSNFWSSGNVHLGVSYTDVGMCQNLSNWIH